MLKLESNNIFLFFLMIRRPPRSTLDRSSAASDVYKRQAGISALSVEFGDEDDGTQYHSIYDDFYWYTHFVDTDFSYGRALAQTAGSAIMRLAGADLIPVDYSPQAEAIAKYESDLE